MLQCYTNLNTCHKYLKHTYIYIPPPTAKENKVFPPFSTYLLFIGFPFFSYWEKPATEKLLPRIFISVPFVCQCNRQRNLA